MSTLHVHAACLFCKSMLHVDGNAACLRPCCMSMSMLYVYFDAACSCPSLAMNFF
jgi:hypothetical protein